MSMNVITLMAIAVLVGAIANLVHWRNRKGTGLLYAPTAGWSRWGSITLSIATVVCALLLLLGCIPDLAFLAVTFGLSLTVALYSIWRRYCQHST